MNGAWLNYRISSYTVIHSWDGNSAGLRCIFSNYMLIHCAAVYISNRAGLLLFFCSVCIIIVIFTAGLPAKPQRKICKRT